MRNAAGHLTFWGILVAVLWQLAIIVIAITLATLLVGWIRKPGGGADKAKAYFQARQTAKDRRKASEKVPA